MVVLYQYFTINTKNNSEEIVINFQNNYYIHSFFKLRGYSDFMNKISKKDIDDLNMIVPRSGDYDFKIHLNKKYVFVEDDDDDIHPSIHPSLDHHRYDEG